MFFDESKFLEQTLNMGLKEHACEIILKSDQRFLTRRFFKVFTIYGRGRHLGHMTKIILTNFFSPDLGMLHMQFG